MTRARAKAKAKVEKEKERRVAKECAKDKLGAAVFDRCTLYIYIYIVVYILYIRKTQHYNVMQYIYNMI